MQFAQCAQSILELDGLLEPLRLLAESCGVPSPEQQHWYALLKQKLVPQLTGKPFLLVAVMGGTNTGKSVVFNHLAGETFSAVDYKASGTKHPVCLVPRMDSTTPLETILARYFDSFRCVPWSNAEQPLELTDENTLFWLEGQNVPDRLLLLDTPDFDADREDNWERAKAVRHAADVVIAVLTEQKYNDAAVRRFFREAAEAGKPIIVLFNMIDPEGDLQHLSRWLEQFRRETGVQPIDVLAAPYNREQAETLKLSFFVVSIPSEAGKNNVPSPPGGRVRVGADLVNGIAPTLALPPGGEGTRNALPQMGEGTLNNHSSKEKGTCLVPVDLKTELSELHFDTIKSQTLLGALKVLDDPKTGVQSYLDSVQQASSRFADAYTTLENIGETEVQWSGLPSAMLAEEIRAWWNSHRPAWSQQVNSVYRKIGGGLLWSARKAVHYFKGNAETETPMSSLEDFRAAEQRTAIEFIGKVMDKLKTLAETDNPVLKREVSELTSGEHRAVLLRRAYSVLDSLPPVDKEFRELLHQRLSDWTAQNPKTAAWMQTLDNIVTAARPLITVSLAITGFAAGAALVGQVIGEAAMAGGITAGGEAAIHAGSEKISGSAANLFRQIQEDYVLERSQRFSKEFQKELWRDVMSRLQAGATVTESDIFRQCRKWRSGGQIINTTSRSV